MKRGARVRKANKNRTILTLNVKRKQSFSQFLSWPFKKLIMAEQGEKVPLDATKPADGVDTPVTVPPGTAAVAAKNPAAQYAHAELCATLHKSLEPSKRIIALVVRAKDTKSARTFADAQIETIAAEIEENALEAEKQATASKAPATLVAEGNQVTAPEAAEAAEEDENDVAQDHTVEWTPDLMMKEYKEQTMPLGGGGNVTTTQPAPKARFAQNFDALKKLNTPTTWLVLERTKKQASVTENETLYYYADSKTKQNKTVVVVRSEVFWLPSSDTTNPAPVTHTSPIFVCSVPASSITNSGVSAYQTSASMKHYDDAFNQISTFVTTYNASLCVGDQIDSVAIAYPMDLYTLHDGAVAAANASAAKKAAAAATKKATLSPKAAAKTNPKPKGNAAKVISTESADHAVLDEYDSEEELSGPATDDGTETARNEERSFYWLKAVHAFAGRHHTIKLRLMNSTASGYKAPPSVLAYFKGRVTVAFPDCVDPENEYAEHPAIGMAQVKRTLFVCDRVAGKRVGNDNDDTTCGGTFGMWIPMHFTSSKIDGAKYKNAADFNKLITVMESDAVVIDG
jgi:hypothetical protein